MQQIFLFFIMLITVSEAFLNGSYISPSNKKKIPGFVPNARIFESVKFGNMDFPEKNDSEPGIISPRDGLTFLSQYTRHKPFSNDDMSGLKEFDKVSFFLQSRKDLNKRRNSTRRLRSMKRKRKMASLFPVTKTINVHSHTGSENSSVPSAISVFSSLVDSNKFYGKSLYPEARSKVVKKKQIKDFRYLPFNSKQFLKHSSLRNKRHEGMESSNVEKHHRDAKTVNVSQANVTKDVEEKKLGKESNDSLNDSHSQDLRPITQHLNDTPSNWKKNLELKSQPVSSSFLSSMADDTDYYDPALDFPSSSMYVPRMDFLVPYDRKVYEDTNLENDENDAKTFRITESKDEVEKKKKNKKRKDKKSEESSDLDKLKHVLDDVENALKDEKGFTNFRIKKKGCKDCERPKGNEDFIRAKIDVVVPLLLQISQELGQRSTQVQRAPAEKNLNFSNLNGVGRGVKENKKYFDCSLDGIWFSNIMGLEINVSTQHNLMLKVTLKSFRKDAIIDNNWSMHGLTLSKTEGPFMLAAVCPVKRKIASFMGQCWMCEEQEYVYGSWTIYSKVQKITDLLTTVETKLDVLTRKKRQS